MKRTIKPLPGSGNHLEDALDAELEELDSKTKKSNILDCGCWGYCKCEPEDDDE